MTLREKKQLTYILAVLTAVGAYWAILRSPLLFMDDALRVYTQMSINQGVHGRPLADLVYQFLSNGLFVDISPLSQIVALMAMIWAGMRLQDCFRSDAVFGREHVLIYSYIIALIFVVFPLNYALISYRYDSLSFGLSILLSTISFAFTVYPPRFYGNYYFNKIFIPPFLLMASLAMYQAMIGIYLCCSLFFLAHIILQNNHWSIFLKKGFIFLRTFCFASIFYLPIYLHAKSMAKADFYGIGPHPHVSAHNHLLDIENLPFSFLANIKLFLKKSISYLGMDIPSFIVIIMLFVLLFMIITKKLSFLRKIVTCFIIICAFISCAGLQLILTSPLFEARTLTPLCAFVTCTFLISISHISIIICKKSIIYMSAIFVISASGILSSIGNAQRDQYIFENELVYNSLEYDIMQLYNNNGLESFYITPLEPPIVTTLKILKDKYGFLKDSGAMSCSFFRCTKLLSYMPINYIFRAHFYQISDIDIDSIKPVITRPNYFIKKIDKRMYCIILRKNDTEPFSRKRFE